MHGGRGRFGLFPPFRDDVSAIRDRRAQRDPRHRVSCSTSGVFAKTADNEFCFLNGELELAGEIPPRRQYLMSYVYRLVL